MALIPFQRTIGTTMTITAQFVDDDYVNVDPSTVTFKIMSPTGTVFASYVYGTDSELVKDAVGVYAVQVVPNASGRWFYRWESTGTGTAIADEGSIVVRTSPFFESVQDAYRT